MPDEIDVKFLKSFKKLIEGQTKKGHRFIISPGGGKTCRKYQTALKAVAAGSHDDLDWIGLNTNKFHAKFLQLIFKNLAEKTIVDEPTKKMPFTKKILIGSGGWKPGRSSDDFAVRLAKLYGAQTVINLSNIDFLYDKDPRKFKSARKIEKISWNGLLKITGRKWRPGANVPFDPTAAKIAQKNKLEVIIANGKNLPNLKNILEGRKFKGSTIR